MAWEWLAPVATVGGAVVGALAAVVSGRATAKSDLRAHETQLRILELQIKSQDRREVFAAKREAYSKVLAEIDAAYFAADAVLEARTRGGDERSARDALDAVMGRVGAVGSEVAVLAGPKVFADVTRVIARMYQYSEGDVGVTELAEARGNVIFALHRDINSESVTD